MTFTIDDDGANPEILESAIIDNQNGFLTVLASDTLGSTTLTISVDDDDADTDTDAIAVFNVLVSDNLIQNGSFEQIVTPNPWNYIHAIPEWTLESGPNFELQKNLLQTSADGSQYLELDAHPLPGSTAVSQTVDTVAGVTYELRFAFARRPGTAVGENALDVDIEDVGSGTALSLLHYSDPGTSGWTYHEATFTATGARTLLRFADAGTLSNTLGTFLDDVSIIRAPLIDLDVDSNNDGTIDPNNHANGTDDPIEKDAPGIIIEVNNDDDNDDGTADNQETPRMDNLGFEYGLENDLALVELNVLDSVLAGLAEGTWTLNLSTETSAGANAISVWRANPNDPLGDLLSVNVDPSVVDPASGLGGTTWYVDNADWPTEVYIEADTLGTFDLNWSLENAEHGLFFIDTVAGTTAQVNLTTFVQEGTTGVLKIGDNPDGELIENEFGDKVLKDPAIAAFGGGDRLFVGGTSVATRNESNNTVRVRAEVENVAVGTLVHFRAYDVDDPSEDDEIDPNGDGVSKGRDNRGRVKDANFEIEFSSESGKPDDSEDADQGDGFEGYLRPINLDDIPERWHEERAVVSAPVRMAADGTLFAEVDLATSFAPGDNFRVGATLSSAEKIRKRNSLPVKKDNAHLSPQLSIWRGLFIEQDRMAETDSVDKENAKVTMRVSAGGGLTTVTLDATFKEDEYSGGIFRNNSKNYHILSNTATAITILLTDHTKIVVDTPTTNSTLYQDDFSTSSLTDGTNQFSVSKFKSVSPVVAGVDTVDVETGVTMPVDMLKDGILRQTGLAGAISTFEIVGNDKDGKLTVKRIGFSVPSVGDAATLFIKITDDAPTTRVDTTKNDGLYDLLQETTDRLKNRFADAYIQPEYDALDEFDSKDGTADSFVASQAHHEVAPGVRMLTEKDGSAANETDLFWVVYSTTGYEAESDRDRDGETGGLLGREQHGTVSVSEGRSIVYLETIRDSYFEKFGLLSDEFAEAPFTDGFTLNYLQSQIMTHEIAHQLIRDNPSMGDSDPDPTHRGGDPNLISPGTVTVFDRNFFMHSLDVGFLRKLKLT